MKNSEGKKNCNQMSSRKNESIEMFPGIKFMGENVRSSLKYCGKEVRLYPLCKIIRGENAELDNNCQIFDNVFIDAGKMLKIGKYSTLTWFVLIEGGAETRIGDRVFVGPGTKLLTSTYELNGCYSIEHLPDDCRGTIYGNITIEDDAYIGANCTIMPGVTIHEGAVVGANALVNTDLDPWGIYVGSPCKKIGTRERPTLEAERIMREFDNWENHL